MMNLTNIWVTWFGTSTWLGLDLGFWASMVAVALIVVVQNIVFWNMKPQKRVTHQKSPEE